MALTLPPGIRSVRKVMPDGIPYYDFHDDWLGLLGAVIVRPDHTTGRSQMDATLAPTAPDDPLAAQREARFTVVVDAISQAIAAKYGPSDPTRTPSMPPPEIRDRAVVGSKIMPCLRCGAFKSHLVFAPGAVTTGDLETQARRLHAKIVEVGLPTWVVGADMDSPDPADFAALVLKVWPEREPITRLTSDGLEAMLDRVVCPHCGEEV